MKNTPRKKAGAMRTAPLVMAAITAASLAGAIASTARADGPAPTSAVVAGGWGLMAGSTLKSTLEGWSRNAGWTLIWDSPVDYRIRASASFSGSFEQSSARLIDSIHQTNPELTATFHRGNRVLHVQNQPLSSN
jgi:hypothetical protein